MQLCGNKVTLPRLLLLLLLLLLLMVVVVVNHMRHLGVLVSPGSPVAHSLNSTALFNHTAAASWLIYIALCFADSCRW